MNTSESNLTNLIPVEAIQERDIDLMILEELKCNPLFIDWVLSKSIGKQDAYTFNGAWHSLSQVGLGESDLAFKISTEKEEIIFLLENKIDANFQFDQANRYRLRGQKRIESNECNSFYTILIAPENYITRNKDFDFYISYEEIKSWFIKQNNMGLRAKYKAELLTIAIEKLRRGYSAIVDEDATDFWWKYFSYANEKYPHLKMVKPQAGIPKRSSFIVFKPKDIGLSKNDKIIHKGYGAVDLQLGGQAENIKLLEQKFESNLTSEMNIVKASKSAAIRIKIDPINVTFGFQNQLEIIEKALSKADILYHWASLNLKKI
ncbi:hypothetical protein [Mangrovimonas sp. ST2L15]|uniref:hypothetical protein n=1 Tax=Mangrovimonas sp. ST2L15 TaxID=1645916 RepID=UPI0006B4981F|nr:hypothetical protein [Mangrovimonas sp. ST2L15]